MVLVVTEPTLSGKHDLERVADLAARFGVTTLVCINKFDINPQMADEIEKFARKRNLKVAGRVCYDKVFTDAQIKALSVIEYSVGSAAEQLRGLWRNVVCDLGDN